MPVEFTSSGSVERVYDSISGREVVDGKTLIINADISSIVKVMDNSSLPANYTISNAHVSKDEYVVVSYSYGLIGDARTHRGFSPTLEASMNTFQEVIDSSIDGTVILSGDSFNETVISGFNLTVSGSGIVVSGLVSGTELGGEYFVGLEALGDSILVVESNSPGVSGINCGRTAFLSRLPANNSASNEGIGVGFVRQGLGLTSSGYKVVCRNYSTASNTVSIGKGQVLSASSIFTGNDRLSREIGYSALEKRIQDVNRLMWIVAEWETDDLGCHITYGYKPYLLGESVQDIIHDYTVVSEFVDLGIVDGVEDGNSFSGTVDSVVWMLNSTTDNDYGLVGIDQIYLESLPKLNKKALHGLRVAGRNTAQSAGSVRPSLNNSLTNFGPPPEGSINFTATPNVLLSNGLGLRGLRQTVLGGDTGTDIATSILEFIEPLSSGIIYGAARSCVFIQDVAANNKSRFGFSFLRQGLDITSDAYTINYHSNSSENAQVAIHKGQAYGSPIGDSTTFSGSIVGTSSTIVGAVGKDVWLDIRWWADVADSKTYIDIYAVVANNDLLKTGFDVSPGNVDYKLQNILSYVDSSSPYLSTSFSPQLILQSTQNCSLNLRQIELRRAKGW